MVDKMINRDKSMDECYYFWTLCLVRAYSRECCWVFRTIQLCRWYNNIIDVIIRHPWFDSALSWLFSYCNQYAPWDYLRNNTENGFLQICLLDRWTRSRNHIANPRGRGKVVSGLLVKINSSAGYKCLWLGEEKKYLFKENRVKTGGENGMEW